MLGTPGLHVAGAGPRQKGWMPRVRRLQPRGGPLRDDARRTAVQWTDSGRRGERRAEHGPAAAARVVRSCRASTDHRALPAQTAERAISVGSRFGVCALEPLRHGRPRSAQAAAHAGSSRSRAWLVATPIAAVAALTGIGLYRLATAGNPTTGVRLRPFATEAHGESQPVWSRDGRSIAYVSAVDGTQTIVVKSLISSTPAPVARCPALCEPIAWSSDGSRIFYQSRTSHLDARLWSVARSGGEPAPVFTDDVVVLASRLSPDGKRLALLRVINLPKDGGRRYGLFLSEPPGAEPVRVEVFPLLHLIQPTRLAWSADSARLLVQELGPGSDPCRLAIREED